MLYFVIFVLENKIIIITNKKKYLFWKKKRCKILLILILNTNDKFICYLRKMDIEIENLEVKNLKQISSFYAKEGIF